MAATEWAAREVRGEVVLVVEGAAPSGPVSAEAIELAVREWLAGDVGDGPRQIAEALSDSLGVAKRRVYETVLRVRSEST